MELGQEWDKIFPQSDKVIHQKVTFKNRYGITLAADFYLPKNSEGKLWPSAVMLRSRLIHPTQVKVAASHAICLRQRATPKISVPQWIFWVCRTISTAIKLVLWVFVALVVWRLMPPLPISVLKPL